MNRKNDLRLGLKLVGIVVLLASTARCTKSEDVQAPPELRYAVNLSKAYQHVARSVQPSVVSVISVQRMSRKSIPQIRDPFNDFFFRFPGAMKPENFERRGQGTGVIVSDDGYILTNNHVVDGADDLSVKLAGGKEYKAQVVGTDPKTDLAVIKIDADDLSPAKLGDSDKLEIGEIVIAVGNPFGLEQTVTTGIVSGKGRSGMGITDYEDFIQTDAAINPGNSGGPLVNLNSEVVGINTAIVSRSGTFNGIGFAIPISMAHSIMDSIIKTGKVDRGWLGVYIQNLDDELAASFGFKDRKGALVGDVPPDGPAAKAGLKAGDIIVKFNGKDVENVNELRNIVAAVKPGTKVEVKIFRNGKYMEVEVEIGLLKSDAGVLVGNKFVSDDLGFTVDNLTEEAVKKYGIEKELGGVVVTGVKKFSIAAAASLAEGDVIISVQGKKINNLREFSDAMHSTDLKNGIRLRVVTAGLTRFVFLKKK